MSLVSFFDRDSRPPLLVQKPFANMCKKDMPIVCHVAVEFVFPAQRLALSPTSPPGTKQTLLRNRVLEQKEMFVFVPDCLPFMGCFSHFLHGYIANINPQ